MLLISYQSTCDMQGQFNYGKFGGIPVLDVYWQFDDVAE